MCERERDRQTDRQRQTDRGSERETDRERERERERELLFGDNVVMRFTPICCGFEHSSLLSYPD